MLFLLWLVVMCVLSSIDGIYVRFEVLVDDAGEAEDDKKGFLIGEVDSFDWLFLEKQPMSLPMVQNSNKNKIW